MYKIKSQITGNSNFRFNMLYYITTYPNIIVPIISGYVVDKIGLVKTFSIFTALSIIGHSLITVSIFLTGKPNTFWYVIILAGRLLFGIGGESLTV